MLRTAAIAEGPMSDRLGSKGVCEFILCWSEEIFALTFMSCLAAGVLNDAGVMFVLVLTKILALIGLFGGDMLGRWGVDKDDGVEKDLSLGVPNLVRISTASLYVSFVFT